MTEIPRGDSDMTGAAVLDRSADELLLESPSAITEQRADCCSARPAYRVSLPSAQAAELLLCGHHYRRHAEALARSGATVS